MVNFSEYIQKAERNLVEAGITTFQGKYIPYDRLKDAIDHDLAYGKADMSRQTSISFSGPAQEYIFNGIFEEAVSLVSRVTDKFMADFRRDANRLLGIVKDGNNLDPQLANTVHKEAEELGERFLRIETYVNINYLGLHKILKKHDKNIPHMRVYGWYASWIHREKWLSGDYSNELLMLSQIFSKLRGDKAGVKNEDSAQGFTRTTRKFWVKAADVSRVKYAVMQHLPVFQFDASNFQGDAQLVNSVYLDNIQCELYHGRLDKAPHAIAVRLRWYGTGEPETVFVERKTHLEAWKGQTSVKERFVLPEKMVLPFLKGEYTWEQMEADMQRAGKDAADIANTKDLFVEVQQAVATKMLRPLTRTQYNRVAFQIPFDATVRISLDTNLSMYKELPGDRGALWGEAGSDNSSSDDQRLDEWRRDEVSHPWSRADVTRFPHAVLEVKLSLPEGEAEPEWVTALTQGGADGSRYCYEVHKFSKFIQGTATLFPDAVQAVPYWIDDKSLKQTMVNCAEVQTNRHGALPERHPLHNVRQTLDIFEETSAPVVSTGGPAPPRGPPQLNFFDRMVNNYKPRLRNIPMKLEPKAFFANERTFLNWLHMAVTIGSISAALLGFAATADRIDGRMAQFASVEIICMILLPLAVLLCGYALALFLWRSKMISLTTEGIIDDRRGPLCLAGVVVLALVAILGLSIRDLVSTMAEKGQDTAFLLSCLVPGGSARAG